MEQGRFKIGARTAVSARSWLQIKFARTRLSALVPRRFLNPACVEPLIDQLVLDVGQIDWRGREQRCVRAGLLVLQRWRQGRFAEAGWRWGQFGHEHSPGLAVARRQLLPTL